MLSSVSYSKLQMIFESELATAWEETETEGMQFSSFMVVLFHISSKTNNETRRNGFQLGVFFSVQSRYVCVSVLLQWGRMRAWEIERAAMLAQVRQTPVEA